MILTIASFKGGVGKTTTAVHLAAYLQQQAPALLIDGDPNRSATAWSKRGSLPFQVIDERQAARYARDYQNIVIDTQARPTQEDLKALADGCDLLILPTSPDALALDALMLTIDALQTLGTDRYRVLLALVPHRPNRDGEEAQTMFKNSSVPVFNGLIRRWASFQKAALLGIPIYSVEDPNSKKAWKEYETIGAEIFHPQEV